MIDTLLPQSVQQKIEFFVLSKVAISYYILNYRAGERNFALYAIRHKHLDIRSDASKRQTYIRNQGYENFESKSGSITCAIMCFHSVSEFEIVNHI